MNHEMLKQRATALSLYGLLEQWEALTTEHIQFLSTWFTWEEEARHHRSLKRRLTQAKIGRFKSLVDFDWKWPKKLDQAAIQELMTLEFLNEASNLIFLGTNGVGKTTIAKNIAHKAVLSGKTVLFTSASNMLNELADQDGDLALRRRLKRYSQPDLLVIDEVGYLSYGDRHADLMFDIVNSRYEKKSTLVTTNRAFSEWHEVFPNASCVVSLVDRLMHHAEVITFEGSSYRLKESKEKDVQRKQARKRNK